jgi:hypothetical protein
MREMILGPSYRGGLCSPWYFKEDLRAEGYTLRTEAIEIEKCFGIYIIRCSIENVTGLFSAVAQSEEIDREAGEEIPPEVVVRTTLRALSRLKQSTGKEAPNHWRP